MAFPWAAAAAGAAQIGSSIFGTISSNNQNKKLAAQQNQYNQQLQQRAFDYNSQQSELEYTRNLEQWNRENEYNSPAAQMQRYIDAGLNPNLIYGSGASAGTAASSPQYTAARYDAPKAERSTNRPINVDAYQAISLGNQIALQRAQVDNLEAQAEYTRANAEYRREELDLGFNHARRSLLVNQSSYLSQRQVLTSLESDKAIEQLSQLRKENPVKVELLKQTLKNMRTQNDIDMLNYELAKIGVNNSDDLWQRIAARIFLNFRDKSSRDSFINKLFK